MFTYGARTRIFRSRKETLMAYTKEEARRLVRVLVEHIESNHDRFRTVIYLNAIVDGNGDCRLGNATQGVLRVLANIIQMFEEEDSSLKSFNDILRYHKDVFENISMETKDSLTVFYKDETPE